MNVCDTNSKNRVHDPVHTTVAPIKLIWFEFLIQRRIFVPDLDKTTCTVYTLFFFFLRNLIFSFEVKLYHIYKIIYHISKYVVSLGFQNLI